MHDIVRIIGEDCLTNVDYIFGSGAMALVIHEVVDHAVLGARLNETNDLLTSFRLQTSVHWVGEHISCSWMIVLSLDITNYPNKATVNTTGNSATVHLERAIDSLRHLAWDKLLYLI